MFCFTHSLFGGSGPRMLKEFSSSITNFLSRDKKLLVYRTRWFFSFSFGFKRKHHRSGSNEFNVQIFIDLFLYFFFSSKFFSFHHNPLTMYSSFQGIFTVADELAKANKCCEHEKMLFPSICSCSFCFFGFETRLNFQ